MAVDAYEAARYVRHYQAKNGYAPRRGMIGATEEEEDLLVKNGIIEIRPIAEGCKPVAIVLTEKGRRMATEQRRRR